MTNLLGFYFLPLLWVLKLLSLLFITFWFIFSFFFSETSFLSISKKTYRGYWLWKQPTDP